MQLPGKVRGKPDSSDLLWGCLILLLSIWAGWKIGAFDWWTTVTLSDGSSRAMPAVWATVDHPFHVARAEVLQRSLADGEWLRWIANHQGGYPVEFYPLGFAGFEVGLWSLLLGSQPMMVVHKVAVWLVFIAPALAFWLLARQSSTSIGVAALATAVQLSVNGWWWSGGFRELVEWGLATNVMASTLLLVAMPLCYRFLFASSMRAGGAAALLIAAAAYTNTRSLVIVCAIAIASLALIALRRFNDAQVDRTIWIRIVVLTVCAAAIAAPQLGSLIRFRDYYYFVQFEDYDSLREYLDSSIEAVSGPVFALGVIGLFLALQQHQEALRFAGITLGVYCLLTMVLVTTDLVDQLEPTRLMPFQRYLTIFMAAYAVWAIAQWLAKLAHRQSLAPAALLLAVITVPLLYVVRPPSFIPEGDRGLYDVATAASPSIAELEQAVDAAELVAVDGTSVLVLGTEVGWHDGLWSPLWTERPLFYDDWLWYWQTEHVGDYDPQTSHSYDDDASTLTNEYLQQHGVGAVVATGEAKLAAAGSPLLLAVMAGEWDVYQVRGPRSIATFDQVNAIESEIRNQEIVAEGAVAGQAEVRRNWFPRWASSQGHVWHRADGYMELDQPSSAIELRYQVDRWDWFFRVLCAVGLSLAAVMIIAPARVTALKPIQESAHR